MLRPCLNMALERPDSTTSSIGKSWYELGYEFIKLLFYLYIWWRRRESNPRPLARHNRLYMLSIRLLI